MLSNWNLNSLAISDSFRTVFVWFCTSKSSEMKAKADSFPLTVKAGSSAVKIYRDRKPSGDYFKVTYYLGGKRHRLNFHEVDKAKAEAAAKAAQLARGDVDAVQLTGKDRLAYGRALDAIKDFGIPLDAATIEYVEARKILERLLPNGRGQVLHAASWPGHNG